MPDRTAQDQLILASLELASLVAAAIRHPHSTFQERNSDAIYGLVRASREYDETLRVPFAAFAKKKMQWESQNSARGGNSLYTQGRRKSRTVSLSDPQHDSYISCYRYNPERIVLERERRREVHAAVGKLPTAWRYVVAQRAFEDADCRSVAAALGVNQSRVSQLWAKALGALKSELPRAG